MSTLSVITAFIDSKIRNKTPKVIKTEHADVDQMIVGELFHDTIVEVSTGTLTITNKILSSISYRLVFNKTGNKTTVFGFITNNTAFPISSQNMIAFTDSEYNSKTSVDTIFEASNGYTQISFSADHIYLVTNIGANETIRINPLTYLNNN